MTRFERWTLWTSTLAAGASGLGFAWVKYLIEPADPWALVNHPLEPWLLKAHVLTAPLFVFAIGLVATRHIWPHIRRGVRTGRRSGLWMAGVLVPMIATGYLVQVWTHASWLGVLAWMHTALGIVFLLGIAVHRVVVPRRARTGVETSVAPARSIGGRAPSPAHERARSA